MGEISPATGSARPRQRAALVAVAVVAAAILTAVGLAAAAHDRATAEPTAPPGPHTLELIEETPPLGLELLGPDGAESLGDPLDADVMRWQTALR